MSPKLIDLGQALAEEIRKMPADVGFSWDALQALKRWYRKMATEGGVPGELEDLVDRAGEIQDVEYPNCYTYGSLLEWGTDWLPVWEKLERSGFVVSSIVTRSRYDSNGFGMSSKFLMLGEVLEKELRKLPSEVGYSLDAFQALKKWYRRIMAERGIPKILESLIDRAGEIQDSEYPRYGTYESLVDWGKDWLPIWEKLKSKGSFEKSKDGKALLDPEKTEIQYLGGQEWVVNGRSVKVPFGGDVSQLLVKVLRLKIGERLPAKDWVGTTSPRVIKARIDRNVKALGIEMGIKAESKPKPATLKRVR